MGLFVARSLHLNVFFKLACKVGSLMVANIKLRVSILFDRDTLEGRNLETASIWFSPLLLLFLLFKRLETTDSSPSIVIYAHTPVYHPSL